MAYVMAYVPGYAHDVFISYAHGDDREWIALLVARLEPALKQRLGIKPVVWIDDEKLRASRDFSEEIPDSVRSSVTFLLLTSPTYIRSQYCVEQECRTFEGTIGPKRARFAADSFTHELFALRCPILATDGNEHWSLFPGLTDIAFCDDNDTFAVGSPAFETSCRRLVGELVGLLKRMRNHSTSVFLYPPDPGPDIADAHAALVAELSANRWSTGTPPLTRMASGMPGAERPLLAGKVRHRSARRIVARSGSLFGGRSKALLQIGDAPRGRARGLPRQGRRRCRARRETGRRRVPATKIAFSPAAGYLRASQKTVRRSP